MRLRRLLAVTATTCLAIAGCATGGKAQDRLPEPPLDPRIAAAVSAISPSRIESRIRTLVGFGTRHTLSETESDRRGIGAARRWIEADLRRCSAEAGGRLQVSLDEHVSPVGPRVPRATPVVNVVATLPGDDPQQRDRLLVVSGHYDSRVSDVMNATADAPGADDDASGVAAVMEVACAMASRHYGATLVFLAVAGEEQGLLGAEHWAAEAARQHLNVEAMITNDIIGSPVGDHGERDAHRVRLYADGLMPLLQTALRPAAGAATLTAVVTGQPPVSPAAIRPPGPATPSQPPVPGGSSPPPASAAPLPIDASAANATGTAAATAAATAELRSRIAAQVRAGGAADFSANQLGRHIKSAGERYLPGFSVDLIQRPDRFLRGGDHLPFLERGYAAARFTEPLEDFAHQHQDLRTENGVRYGDEMAFVDVAYVADVARINLAALASLALAPRPPRNARLEALALVNDSTLTWDASDEPNVVGYRILWRDTGSPVWQQAQDVGRVQRATVPASKDNVVFGVQALDSQGHASLASFPLPKTR